jgi:hypothetical protein
MRATPVNFVGDISEARSWADIAALRILELSNLEKRRFDNAVSIV